MAGERVTKHYFVDEAGDLTIFGKGGKVVLGQEDVSRCFMLGSAVLPDPSLAHSKLEALRQELMEDPFFSYAPSMHPDNKKTARCFHAKDDLPEVRHEVMKLLPSLGATVVIVIRRKEALVERFEEHKKGRGKTRMQNIVYDELVTEVFRNNLRSGLENRVTFAHRDTKVRGRALRDALRQAGQSKGCDCSPHVESAFTWESAGLQVVDYYLWAVQRLYERQQERFFRALESQYVRIIDLDDRRIGGQSAQYSKTNRLTPAKIKPFAS